MFGMESSDEGRTDVSVPRQSILTARQLHGGGGGRNIGRYADSLPLSSQFQGGGVWGGGGGVWGRLKGRGALGPQHIWLKMTPSSR